MAPDPSPTLVSMVDTRTTIPIAEAPPRTVESGKDLNGWYKSGSGSETKLSTLTPNKEASVDQSQDGFESCRPSSQFMSLTYAISLFQWHANCSPNRPASLQQKPAHPEPIPKPAGLGNSQIKSNLQIKIYKYLWLSSTSVNQSVSQAFAWRWCPVESRQQ